MIYEKIIEEEAKTLDALGGLVEVYGELASVRMRKIRNFVLLNRDFLRAINNIFQDALAAYAKKLALLARRGKIKKGKRVTFLAHNGKTVAVLISANTGLYGDVVQKTFKRFLKEVRNKNVEVTIVGKLGLSMFMEAEHDRPHTYFQLPDYGINKEKLSEVIRHLVQYEEIRVYYGEYQSVITQTPTMFKISAGTAVTEDVGKPKVEYIFEPSVEQILMFFETQIFASLFDQSIRESQLAKFASRIMAMDRAGENIRDEIKKIKLEKLKLTHRVANRKQLNSLSSAVYS
jgi:ATP synthase F1 gamma subunit